MAYLDAPIFKALCSDALQARLAELYLMPKRFTDLL
jgi:hypothetical protein